MFWHGHIHTVCRTEDIIIGLGDIYHLQKEKCGVVMIITLFFYKGDLFLLSAWWSCLKSKLSCNWRRGECTEYTLTQLPHCRLSLLAGQFFAPLPFLNKPKWKRINKRCLEFPLGVPSLQISPNSQWHFWQFLDAYLFIEKFMLHSCKTLPVFMVSNIHAFFHLENITVK